jgi:hypothetical protein
MARSTANLRTIIVVTCGFDAHKNSQQLEDSTDDDVLGRYLCRGAVEIISTA